MVGGYSAGTSQYRKYGAGNQTVGLAKHDDARGTFLDPIVSTIEPCKQGKAPARQVDVIGENAGGGNHTVGPVAER
jgi:hypothetical protein